ncbi:MAG: HisA/HisF-related TIM barrel protein [Patescibacteria group bacterium]
MKLHGIDFGNVLGASGVQGFFGEGYWFHRVWNLFGLNFAGMTFVAKTATLLSRKGNMSLTRHYTPRSPFPGCVKTQLWRGVMLNSIGLSNPGIGALLGAGKWQKRTKPFLLSIMSLADTPQRRLEELRIMVEMIGFCKESFSAPFGLQINLSCPNTEHDPHELIGESAKVLEIASALGVPLMPKYSIASASIQAVLQLNDHPNCDAICVSNTLPFGWTGVDWERVWGSKTSPLAKLGGGGLSGKTLQPLVCEWITRLRDAGFTKPINGGGGILCSEDVKRYHDAGASSIFLGSVAVLRPWRVKKIINQANNLNWR